MRERHVYEHAEVHAHARLPLAYPDSQRADHFDRQSKYLADELRKDCALWPTTIPSLFSFALVLYLSINLYYLLLYYIHTRRLHCTWVYISRMRCITVKPSNTRNVQRTVANRAWCSRTEFRRLWNLGGLVFLLSLPSAIQRPRKPFVRFFRRMSKTRPAMLNQIVERLKSRIVIMSGIFWNFSMNTRFRVRFFFLAKI